MVSPKDSAALLQQVRDTARDVGLDWMEASVTGDLILAGRKETLERFKTRTSPQVPSGAMAAALQACAGRTVQVVLIPNADHRRVLAEMLPAIIGRPAISPVQGLKWAALGLDGPPSLCLDLVVETDGPDSAKALLEVIQGLCAWAAQTPEVRSLVQDLDPVLADLTPKVQGSRLVLTLDQTRADALIRRLVGPALMQAREKARRLTCASHLKQVGLGVILYANDHKDQLPPDLQPLIAAGSVPEVCLACPRLGPRGPMCTEELV